MLCPVALTWSAMAEVFTEQIAGIVMVFILVKLNGGFTIEKPNILRPSLKMTILQPLLTTSRPLDTTSSGTGAPYLEPATPIIRQCNGIFTNQSIFRYFSREIGQFQST